MIKRMSKEEKERRKQQNFVRFACWSVFVTMVFSHSQSNWLNHRLPMCAVCFVQLYWEHVVATHHILLIWWTIFSRSSYVEWIISKRHTFWRLFGSLNFVSFYIRFRSASSVFSYHLLFYFNIFALFVRCFYFPVYSTPKNYVKFVAFILVRCSFLEWTFQLKIKYKWSIKDKCACGKFCQ